MIDPWNSGTVNDGSLWSTIMLWQLFFYCVAEVIISAVYEDSTFPLWDLCYPHWHPHYSVFRRLRLIGGLNQYYCFTWIQSILSLPSGRLPRILTSPSVRSSKGSWKVLPRKEVWRLWWPESFSFYIWGFQRRGRPRVTSLSPGTWRSHQIWGWGDPKTIILSWDCWNPSHIQMSSPSGAFTHSEVLQTQCCSADSCQC